MTALRLRVAAAQDVTDVVATDIADVSGGADGR